MSKERIHIIDGLDMGLRNRTAIYVLDETDLTLIETGPSASGKYIEAGLKNLGFKLEDVKNIIVTHIHLDHAGGAGQLLEQCPNAKVFVHHKGARHLVDPSRLIAGAKAVYRDKFEPLFAPVIAIPEERLVSVEEGDTLTISEHCTLQFWDTPGHANHHLSIYDPVSHTLFTGDTVGIRYQQLIDDGIHFYLPSTSPNQFDPNKMMASIKRMQAADLKGLYFGHYGMSSNVSDVYEQVEKWLEIFLREAQDVFEQGGNATMLKERLYQLVMNALLEEGVKPSHEVFSIIQLDLEVSAMGLLDYLAKKSSV